MENLLDILEVTVDLFVICMNVLSRMLDKSAMEERIGFLPKCKTASLTHLCFADDIMVFIDGTQRSIEETMKIFGEFAIKSGLKISIEKSTIYMAGIIDVNRRLISSSIRETTSSISWFAASH